MVSVEVMTRVEQLAALCQVRQLQVGLAESCTGGLLSSWLCAYPGASAFYRGAVVSYSGRVKQRVLAVPSALMKTHGEVSGPVARAMAEGARVALECDWAVAITGIAGPSGGTAEKPVGTVCFAVAGPGFVRVDQQQFAAHGGRQDIQRQAALFAFDFLLNGMR